MARIYYRYAHHRSAREGEPNEEHYGGGVFPAASMAEARIIATRAIPEGARLTEIVCTTPHERKVGSRPVLFCDVCGAVGNCPEALRLPGNPGFKKGQ